MDNGLTGLIGLAKKAGKLQAGEEPVTLAAKTHKARLILLAADAADNTRHRGETLAQTGNCPLLSTPLSKAELGYALGRSSCAILALTDVGLAAAITERLAQQDPQQYESVQRQLSHKAEKTLRRRREQRDKEKAALAARRKPWAPPQAKTPL